jgi:hypothetical protein
MQLRTTPFHPRTSALVHGYAWRRWAGYVAASSYELSHEREYAAIRSSAALFDVTPLFKYHLTGPDAVRLIDRVVTRDISRCKVGQVMYTPWCDEDGKVIDDGTVSRLDEQRFRLTSADPNLRWLQENAFKRLTQSSKTGIEDLALIASNTPELLQDEVFTTKKMRPLIEKILTLESNLSRSPSVNMVDARRSQLSAIMINKGIEFLKLQYEFLEHDSPGLANIVLDQLSHAARISNEIANKVELLNIRHVASKSKLEYLFNWKKVTEKDEKLWSYLYGHLGEPFGITRLKRSSDDRKIRFDLISPYDTAMGSSSGSCPRMCVGRECAQASSGRLGSRNPSGSARLCSPSGPKHLRR